MSTPTQLTLTGPQAGELAYYLGWRNADADVTLTMQGDGSLIVADERDTAEITAAGTAFTRI